MKILEGVLIFTITVVVWIIMRASLKPKISDGERIFYKIIVLILALFEGAVLATLSIMNAIYALALLVAVILFLNWRGPEWWRSDKKWDRKSKKYV